MTPAWIAVLSAASVFAVAVVAIIVAPVSWLGRSSDASARSAAAARLVPLAVPSRSPGARARSGR